VNSKETKNVMGIGQERKKKKLLREKETKKKN
jgi:hypothetical protein